VTGCLSLPFIINYGLLELFLVSATSSVLPIPTEPTIVLMLSENVSPLVILLVLIPASVLGASVGYLLGKYGIRRIIPFHNPEREERVRAWFGKYGAALLIISPWIPFAGDVVPIVAGIEEFNPTTFLIIMFVAKAIKGTAIVYFLSFFVQLVGLHL
jgi:membrane protein YqaA with SNARE-associated domain